MSRVFLPQTLVDLWAMLAEEPDTLVYCGGTDLLVHLRAGLRRPAALVCVERVAELKGVRESEAAVWIGAATTHEALLLNPTVTRRLSVLAQALRTLGSPQIRAMGTIGGNICTAGPAGDSLPPLYALGAEVVLQTRRATRTMPLQDFIIGPGQTRLADGEVLTAVRVALPERWDLSHFEKVGRRRSLACSVASLAALARVSPLGVVEAVRLAWGSVGPTVVTLPEVEAALVGQRLTGTALAAAARLAARQVSPIDDVRATARYRREVAGNLLLRLEGRPTA